MNAAIAIVGMACRYPDARSPEELWNNALAQRRAFRRMPDERLRLEDYYSPDPNAPDRTYGTQAAVIEDYEFDRVRFRVVGSTFRSADMAHWLALDISTAALADAGFTDGEGLPQETTGVLLGNTLTGEFSRSNVMRLRWPYVRRVVEAALAAEGWTSQDRLRFLKDLEKGYKRPFPPVGEETLAGGLSNTIAGRICNQFDLKGGGYTVDGACSSSLLAIINACFSLTSGDLDVALAGGVDLSLDPFELVGFAKTKALAPQMMRVYDVRSAGFWPGEGCGMVVLMRQEDAIAQKRRIYATIRGWGISSDGSGGITRPEEKGQLLALKRAYRRAGFSPDTVGYFEGHGTGTEVGDAAELRVLSRARREAGAAPEPAALSTIKANIGHTKAAAGAAGLIKATMALHHQVLPPTTGCERPHPELAGDAPVLRTLRQGEPWPVDVALRAAVSAMGFGGINTHVVLEGAATERHKSLDVKTDTLRRSAQDAELFMIGGKDAAALREQVDRLSAVAPGISQAEMADLAASLTLATKGLSKGLSNDCGTGVSPVSPHGPEARATGGLGVGANDLPDGEHPPAQRAGLSQAGPPAGGSGGWRVRAAIVASSPTELASRLETLVEWLGEEPFQMRDHAPTNVGGSLRLDIRAGVFLGMPGDVCLHKRDACATVEPRIGFLFPGQGSPAHLDGGALRRRFASADELYAKSALPTGVDGVATEVAQPAIATASMAALDVLESLGVQASVALGHSLGELAALCWGGAYDRDALLRIARARGKAMAELGSPTGTMAAFRAGQQEVEQLLQETSRRQNAKTPESAVRNPQSAIPNLQSAVAIANLNSPHQTVISGDSQAVAAIVDRAKAKGLSAVQLPVSHAFHSPLVAAAAPFLGQHLAREEMRHLQRTVVSTVTGTRLESDVDVAELLCRQVISPVRFMEAVRAAVGDECAPRPRPGALDRGGEAAGQEGAEKGFTAQRKPVDLDEGLDLLIEVGPGEVLSGLVADFVDVPVVAIDAGGPSLAGLLRAVGAAYVLGASVNHEALFVGRYTKPFDIDHRPSFFVNPCERAPVSETGWQYEEEEAEAEATVPQGSAGALASVTPGAPPLEVVRQLVAERAELPVSAVKDDNRLLGDLHLNSIAVGQLVAESARRLGLPPPVSATDYADATVAGVAQAFEELVRTGGAELREDEQRFPPGVEAWIRTFTVELVDLPLPRRKPPMLVGGAGWRVMSPPGHPLKDAIQEAFDQAGAGGGTVVCLPPDPNEEHVGLLLDASRAVMAEDAEPRFVVVQHGGGGASFARALHLERPRITTCVVDVPIDHPEAVQWVVAEAMVDQGYTEVHYGADGRPRVPRLRLLAIKQDDEAGRDDEAAKEPACVKPVPPESALRPRPGALGLGTLGPDDVLLVTGGGKGIAAECALAIARESGARLALLGRSKPESSDELSANLERMAAAGVQFCYVPADVTDAGQVRDAIRQAEAEQGPVTAVLHGAGINVPKLLTSLDEAAFHETLKPKLQGIRNVLAAIDVDRLRLLVTFGSIIARTGMQGEAHYAVANEWLGQLIDRWQAERPDCRCLTLEWSVWSGIGMGERLGRIDALVQQGITPIPTDEGIRQMYRLLAQQTPSTRVVITGRFGDPPTLRMEQPDLPLLRFVENARVHYPGVELVLDVELTPKADPYLEDHVFAGERLFPAVMGMEAMAQVAMTLLDTEEVPTFENVKFNRPIVVSDGDNESIRLAALVRSSGDVDVVVRSKKTGFQADHFSAKCVFETSKRRRKRQNAKTPKCQLSIVNPQSAIVNLDPERDLYGGILFHTGRFRRLRGYHRLMATECHAEISPGGGVDWFDRFLPGDLVLGDPGARDAAIHAIQPCIPHARILPVGVDRVEPMLAQTSGPRFVTASERSRDGDTFIYDLEVRRADGTVCERWEGLHLQVVEGTRSRAPWIEPLLGPYIERRVGELIPGADVNVFVERSTATERRERSDRAIQQVLGSGEPVRRRPDGKPDATPDGRAVSAAHAGDLTLAVAGPAPVGCDVEPVTPRSAETWRDLLGRERFVLAEIVAREAEEDSDTAATRVWAACECLRKAGAALDAPLVLASTKGDGWIMLSSGPLTTATLVVPVRGRQELLAIGILTRSHRASL